MSDIEQAQFIQDFIAEVESLIENVEAIQRVLACKERPGALLHGQLRRNFEAMLAEARSRRAHTYDKAEKNGLMGLECITKLHALTF